MAASGVLEVLNLGATARTHCYWPEVELGIKQPDGKIALTEDTNDPEVVAILMFDSLSTRYWNERFMCATNYATSRRLRVVYVDGSNRSLTTEATLSPYRAVLQTYLQDRNESNELIAEAGLPNVGWSGIHWPGVYLNGLFVILVVGIPEVLLFAPAFALSPAARARRRLAANHCPRCDYDLRASRDGRCPECGWLTTHDID
jgi:hypothetical protein